MLVLKTQGSANFRKCVLMIRRMDYVDTFKKGYENWVRVVTGLHCIVTASMVVIFPTDLSLWAT